MVQKFTERLKRSRSRFQKTVAQGETEIFVSGNKASNSATDQLDRVFTINVSESKAF